MLRRRHSTLRGLRRALAPGLLLGVLALAAVVGCSSGPIDPGETISVPLAPSGEPELAQGEAATFIVPIAVTSTGHSLEYRFDWGDGAVSDWALGTASDHSWGTAGSFLVRARARCATHTSEQSSWSDPLTVSILAGDPVCTVDPADLSFGTVKVGQTLDQTFRITNTGGGTLTGDVGESCADYSIVSGGGPFSLEADQVLTVTVRFAPMSAGAKTCTVRTGCTTDVACTGVGRDPLPGPVCTVSPASLAFGTVTVGQFVERTFTITNTGGGTLAGTAGSNCFVAYSVVSGAGPYSLAAGESHAVTVRFAPAGAGYTECAIGTGTACAPVLCTGTGGSVPGLCVVNPTSLVFGVIPVGQSLDQTFTITNAGGGTLTGSVSESCADYSIVSGGGSYSLTAGEVRTVTVRATPLSTGLRACTIQTGCESVSCLTMGGTPAP